MSGMFFAEPAVLLVFHPVGVFALVLGVVIIPAFAIHASQSDYLSHFIYPILLFPIN
jgi:hypothetical protein